MEYSVKSITLGEVTAIYLTHKDVTTFSLVPTSLLGKVNYDKIAGNIFPAFGHVRPTPIVDVTLKGDGFARWFISGDYMHFSDTALSLKLINIKENIGKDGTSVVVTLRNDKIEAEHILFHRNASMVVAVNTVIKNISNKEITLLSVPSFTISGISPVGELNQADKMSIYDMQNYWSSEGRFHVQKFSDLSMFDSWSHFGLRGYTLTQKGSFPCRSHLPFIGVRDEENDISYAVSIYEPGSWQLEAVHANSNSFISGGMIDFNNGHFSKTLLPGDVYSTHRSDICCLKGTMLEAMREISLNNRQITNPSPFEEDLPLVYNEYLFTFGDPTMEKLRPLIPKAKDKGCKYFVMDAGWYDNCHQWQTLGDWVPSLNRFPNGLKEFTKEVRDNGMIPGIWFEYESASDTSDIFINHPEYFLKRDGVFVKNESRVFLDLRKEEVIDYLTTKVIKLLKDNDFGYLKVDYNENIGIGVDGTDGLAEELNKHLEGSLNFFKKIKEELPDLVLEMCSSGGNRHSPAYLELADMCSFSDAHYDDEGAPIAMGLHAYIAPKKLQIWSEINDSFSDDKIYFSLAKGMLGRICISNDFSKLNAHQDALLMEGLKYYSELKDVIKNGKTTLISNETSDFRHIENNIWHLIRETNNEKVIYYFAVSTDKKEFSIPIKETQELSHYGNVNFVIKDNKLNIQNDITRRYNVLVLKLKKGE